MERRFMPLADRQIAFETRRRVPINAWRLNAWLDVL